MHSSQCILLLLLAIILTPATAPALGPEHVAVVANAKARDSQDLARYYMERRGIPAEQLIVLRTSWQEICSREDYERQVREPVRQALRALREGGRPIRCLVTVFGMPLKIDPPRPSWSEEEQIAIFQQQLKALPDQQSPEAKKLEHHIGSLTRTSSRAALDSELSLVEIENYPLEGWQANPVFLGFKGRNNLLPRDKVLLVSRLDGPEPALVRRLIDDALATEAEGLRGQLCLDARWPRPEMKNLKSYALYDAALHLSAELVPQRRAMPVVLDEREELLPPGRCDKTALYCGWYSLGRYVDAFVWQRGAVGYHIASAECATLKDANSTVWCKRMLEQGAAAVIGPVHEPYVEAFPLPDVFFAHLVDGRPSLVESYYLSLPYLSWQMVLVGDPLYRPYKNAPNTTAAPVSR